MSNIIRERVTSVYHWNDTLFSFKTSRNDSFRFHNGHFTMIGIEVEEAADASLQYRQRKL